VIRDIQKIYNRLLNRIFLLFARGILKAIDDSGKTQKVQTICLAGETISDVERFEQYGLSTYPLADSETFTAFLGGNRSQGIVLCVHDRRYRPDYLAEGEVCIYTSVDKSTNHRILMTSDGKIKMYGDKYYISNNAEDLIDLMVQFCEAAENITVATAIGVQPVLNKATFTALKAKLTAFKV